MSFPHDPDPDRLPPGYAALTITQHDEAGTNVVVMAGTLTSITARRARAQLSAASYTSSTVIVDLDAVTLLDSAGLSVLATLRRHLRAQDRALFLVVTSSITLRLVSLTGLDQVMPVHPTVSSALADLRDQRR